MSNRINHFPCFVSTLRPCVRSTQAKTNWNRMCWKCWVHILGCYKIYFMMFLCISRFSPLERFNNLVPDCPPSQKLHKAHDPVLRSVSEYRASKDTHHKSALLSNFSYFQNNNGYNINKLHSQSLQSIFKYMFRTLLFKFTEFCTLLWDF